MKQDNNAPWDPGAVILYPILSMTASIAVLLIEIASTGITSCIGWWLMTFVFGFIVSGLLPFVMITVFKIDTSPYVKGKFILLSVFFFLNILAWTVLFQDGISVLLFPVVSYVAELCYALMKGRNWKEITVLFLTNLNIVYLAFIADLVHGINTDAPWF